MLAHHSAVSIAHQAFQALFRSRRRTAKAREEKIRLFNLPADVNHDQQIVTIRCQHLLEFALEVMDALVEFMDLLHGPGPFEVWTPDLWSGMSFHDRYVHHKVLEAYNSQMREICSNPKRYKEEFGSSTKTNAPN